MPKSNPTKYRVHTWLDTNTMQPVHGIQARISGKWLHCSAGDKPLLYPDAEKEKAARHCRWLNNPKETEEEWGPNKPAN